jgi:hypothetical protein
MGRAERIHRGRHSLANSRATPERRYDRPVKGAGLFVTWVALAACGRIGFDAVPGAGDAQLGDGPGNDGRARDGSAASVRFIQATSRIAGAVRTLAAVTTQPVSAGDLLVVGWSLDGPPPTMATISDSLGTSFTTVSTGVAAPLVVYLAYGYAASSAIDTFTITITSTPNSYLELQAWEFAGIASDGFVAAEQAQGQSLATNGVQTPGIAVSTTGSDLLFAWGVFAFSGTISAGFTQVSDNDTDPAEYAIVSGPDPVVATMTQNAGGTDWTIVGATFETE